MVKGNLFMEKGADPYAFRIKVSSLLISHQHRPLSAAS
ncbi:hypothetical protein SD78_2001 [Bacillus badius]|nr:hypothetical protein SD78_2001 [Bacillus badius]